MGQNGCTFERNKWTEKQLYCLQLSNQKDFGDIET